MAKKEVKIADKEQQVKQPLTEVNDVNAPTPEEKAEILMPQIEVTGDDKAAATATIPAVKEEVEDPNLSSEDVINTLGGADSPIENELAFGTFDDKRSVKFTIDPDNVKANQYAVEDFREFIEQFRDEKGAKPNLMYVNTTSLNKLGYRDEAVSNGIHIQENTVYKANQLILALDL